ncbi:sulfate adenylyltransferase subunit CysD [Corynebacterium sp. HMSC28B08]|uniref:sulfate adenylyltransferase subunit CysD n=1 Tax=Corynebacterium sp. HMSC28B08 TaxID=1581066 RepID=UPI000A7237A3|nr:sulfate adenylyltransferase subunit CysD [Corynebacterium sp. HMSC28B08]
MTTANAEAPLPATSSSPAPQLNATNPTANTEKTTKEANDVQERTQEPSQAPALSPHLASLEAEAIEILREVAGQFERPALLFSGGKDSVVVLELAKRAFAPSPVPFELVHVDTGHNFPEVIEFRDKVAADPRVNLHVALVQDWIDSGAIQERPDGTRNPLQTVPLVETIQNRGYDAVLGGARRDEEKARAKERVFSVRDSFGGWNPRRQRPELWGLYNGRHQVGENIRVFPISNWTEADVWDYIRDRDVEVPAIYYSHQREVFERNGMWLTPGEWGGPKEGEELVTKTVRYRTVGDMSCTGAVLSEATSIEDVIDEIRTSTTTERGATRADDKLSESSMEDRKKEGYF